MEFVIRDTYTELAPTWRVRRPDLTVDLFAVAAELGRATLGGIQLEPADDGSRLQLDGVADTDAGLTVMPELDGEPLAVTQSPDESIDATLGTLEIDNSEAGYDLRFRDSDTVALGKFGDRSALHLGPTEADAYDDGGQIRLYHRFADLSVFLDADSALFRLGSTDWFDPTIYDDDDLFPGLGGDETEAAAAGLVTIGEDSFVFDARHDEALEETASVSIGEDAIDGEGDGRLAITYWEDEDDGRAGLVYAEGRLSLKRPQEDGSEVTTIEAVDGRGPDGESQPAVRVSDGEGSETLALDGGLGRVTVADSDGNGNVVGEPSSLTCRLDGGAVSVVDADGNSVFEVTEDHLVIDGELSVDGSIPQAFVDAAEDS